MERIVVRINTTELGMTARDTPTAKAILKELPLQAVAQTWGDEIYFRVPVSAALEDDARDIVEKGEIAFWTGGSAIAIGYGRTPASRGDEIRLVTAVNVWADAHGDPAVLRNVRDGDPVWIGLARDAD
jgi:hypothetical protein